MSYMNLAHEGGGAVVVGAGAAGLAVAYALKQAGIPVVIVEKSDTVASAWWGRHPQLYLNTHRRLSQLPGMKLPASTGAFPSRDAIIGYLTDYARFTEVRILFETAVHRIDRDGDDWLVKTSNGRLRARHVIVATGRESVPHVPEWQGREGFAGEIRHAADFGEVGQYRGKRVLVVGAGNSGSDVLNHLSRIKTDAVCVSVRHGSVIAPTRVLGIPIQLMSPLIEMLPLGAADRFLQGAQRANFGDLTRYGLPRPAGGATRLAREGVSPAIDNGFVAAIKQGRIKVVPEIKRFDPTGVVFEDDSRFELDVVIAATGYRTGLAPLLGHLEVLTAKGEPITDGAVPIVHAPGLWFAGMRPGLSGYFQAASRQSRDLARVVAADMAAKAKGETNAAEFSLAAADG
ncbi:MAG: NAD(P)/FAD-dependent oxidoreductase [Hyphomicrobiales bacterium]|nr:NAD(P)/FAD-dependent oxidoreductase [Hyphomicrobiales bacterium]